MYELVMRIPENDLVGFLCGSLAILCGTTVMLTFILTIGWSRYSQRQLATPLIQEMLDRGMSADEIETIFAAAWAGRSRRLSRWFRTALRSMPARAQATV